MAVSVRIEMLGRLAVLVDGRPAEGFHSPRPSGLLAFLAYHAGTRQSRDVLIEQFWPEADTESGRNRLNVTLARIRASLREASPQAADAVQSDRFNVWVDPAIVETDVRELDEHLHRANSPGPDALDQLKRALELYRGPLLPGSYEEWIAPERERLAEAARHVASRLVSLLEGAGKPDEALEYARKAVHDDPLVEESHRDVMRLLASVGRTGEALQQYSALETMLRDELGASPEPASRSLCEEIRSKSYGTNGSTKTNGASKTNGAAKTNAVSNSNGANGSYGTARESLLPVDAYGDLLSRSAPNIPREGTEHVSERRKTIRRRVIASFAAIAYVAALAAMNAHRLPVAIPPLKSSKPPAAKLNKLLWAYIYPYAADETISEPLALTSDRHGNTYVSGLVRTKDHDVDALILKVSPDGKQLWKQRYNGPANDCERGWFLKLDPSGDLYVVCDSYNGDRAKGGTEWDILLLKYSSDGKLLWDRRLNGSGNRDEKPSGLGMDAAGNIYVAGTTVDDRNRSGFLLAKYASNGSAVWTIFDVGGAHQFVMSDIGLGSLVVEPDGTSFTTTVATIRDGNGHVTRDLITARYDRHGNQIWLRRYTPDSPGAITGERVTVDAEHNVYAAAMSRLPSPASEPTKRELPIVIKYDSDGKEKWSTTCDQVQSGVGFGVSRLVVAPGGYVYAAIQTDFGANMATGYLYAFNPIGKQLWRKEFPWSRMYGAEADSEGVFVSYEQVRDWRNPIAPTLLQSRHYARDDGHEIWVATWDPKAARIHENTLQLTADGKLTTAGQIWPKTDPPQLFLVQYPR